MNRSSKIPQKLLKIKKEFQKELEFYATDKTKKRTDMFLKNEVESRGLDMKSMNTVFNGIWDINKGKLNYNEKKQLGLDLFKDPRIEDRCIGFRIFNDIHTEIKNEHINEIKDIILKGYVKEWGTLDTLCSRVLTPWSQLSQKNTEYIAQWRFEKNNLWVRRASCVTFVNRARLGDQNEVNFTGFSDLMFEICQEVVKHQERFNQLGCGWLMRNLTVSHRQRAIQFIEDNYDYWSREGLRYAVRKLNEKEKNRLMNFNKNLKQKKQNFKSNDEINSSDEEQEEENEETKSKRKPVKKRNLKTKLK